MVDSGEHENLPSDSLQGKEFRDHLSTYQILKNDSAP
jgi:hypothetical protein